MDLFNYTKVLFERIQKIEPELVSKIIGYLLLQDNGYCEMIRLAFGPDTAIHSLVNEAKHAIPLMATIFTPVLHDIPLKFMPCPPNMPQTLPCLPLCVPPPCWDPQIVPDQQPVVHNIDFVPTMYDSVGDGYMIHNSARFLNLDPRNPTGANFTSNQFFQDAPQEPCHYHYKGLCKHGSNCKYLHGQPIPDSCTQVFSTCSTELANEDHVFSPRSLEKLELDLTRLLRSQGREPISIAMLPTLYHEKYGKDLQAEGYLSESQRHGKAGYSLTKLLSQFKNSIRLIERPHGQHYVMLSEYALKHERSDGSLQIYLTFPAESKFTEDDVSNYFSQFGRVHSVRIPTQQQRMFGFVTFIHPETVKSVFMKGNPHYICGSRVLVKPYQEKSKGAGRKYNEKVETSMPPSQYLEIDPRLHSTPRTKNSRLLSKQLIEEHGQALELQRRCLSVLPLTPRQLSQQPYFGYSVEEIRVPEAGHFSCQFDAISNGSSSDDKAGCTSNNLIDKESDQIDLPDSPFAYPLVGR